MKKKKELIQQALKNKRSKMKTQHAEPAEEQAEAKDIPAPQEKRTTKTKEVSNSSDKAQSSPKK